MKEDVPGFEKTVAPLNAPSNIRIGVSTNLGPISTREVCGGPLGCNGSFSMICKVRRVSVLASGGFGGELAYLEVTEPYFVVKQREGEDVVDERLRLTCLRGHTEYLHPHIANPP